LRWISPTILLMACALSTGAAARDANTEGGRQLAQRVCASCHIVSADQPVPPIPGYGPSFFDLATRSDITPQWLHGFLARRQAMHRMPDLQLTNRQIEDVSAYLFSLR